MIDYLLLLRPARKYHIQMDTSHIWVYALRLNPLSRGVSAMKLCFGFHIPTRVMIFQNLSNKTKKYFTVYFSNHIFMSSLTLKTIIDILAFDKKKMDQLFSSLTCLGKRYTIVCILQTNSVYNTNIMLLNQHPVSYLIEILFVPLFSK